MGIFNILGFYGVIKQRKWNTVSVVHYFTCKICQLRNDESKWVLSRLYIQEMENSNCNYILSCSMLIVQYTNWWIVYRNSKRYFSSCQNICHLFLGMKETDLRCNKNKWFFLGLMPPLLNSLVNHGMKKFTVVTLVDST